VGFYLVSYIDVDPCLGFNSGRSGVISTKKIKSNMLAAVLILTVTPSWVKFGRQVIEHTCYLISQKLQDADEVRRGVVSFSGLSSLLGLS